MKNNHIITLLIATVFVLVVAMQVTIYNSLSDQQEDTTVINYAGRQRMLSQSIAKTVQKIQIAANQNKTFKEKRLELRKITDQFVEVHQGLTKGNEALGLSGKNSPTIERMFGEIETLYNVLSSNALQLAVENKEQDFQNLVNAIVTTEESFLAQMDAIVNQYEVEANQQYAKLKRLIMMLGGLCLLIFGSMVLFVVRPYLRSLSEKNIELSLNNKTLATKYREFDAAKVQTETKNRQLQRKNEIYTQKAVRLEKELQELKQVNATNQYFLSGYTKEYPAILNQHLGILELLEKEETLDKKAQIIQLFKSSINNQRMVIDKIHEYQALESGKMESDQLPFDIKRVVEEIKQLLSPKANYLQINFKINTSTDFPDRMIGDENYLGQALFLLLDNALDNDKGSDVTFDVFLNHVNENHQAHIDFAISDTTRYISEEHFEDLFDLTHPANAENRLYNKLDIAIAKKLLALLKSAIKIESSPENGTTFYFSLTLPVESPVAESYYKIG